MKRTFKELYELVLKELERGTGNHGICNIIDNLYWDKYITKEEYINLEAHLEEQKPTDKNKFKSFYKDSLFLGGMWWWERMRDGLEYRAVRISFVKAILSTLK